MYELLKTKSRPSRDQVKPTQIRKQGMVPGIIYGSGITPIRFKVPELQLKNCLSKSGVVFEVEVDGKEKHLVQLRRVDRHPVSMKNIHVALHKVRQDQEALIKLPIEFVGTPIGKREGAHLIPNMMEVEVKGLPKDMPHTLQVDVSAMDVGSVLILGDIKLPKGLSFTHHDHLEQPVASCIMPRMREVEAPVVVAPVVEAVEGQPVEEAAGKNAPEAAPEKETRGPQKKAA